MRFTLLCLYCTFLTAAWAQPVPKPESARYWADHGSQLMKGGQFARAYSAFQLARSLGAPGMVPRMEDARRRNVNYILLQSLLSEARSLADTDPAQGMRLLEHAHRYFPDSSRIMQQLGMLVNQPNLWPFSLKSAQLWPSPKLRYLVASTSPARLYACRGDSLTTLFTFAAPVEDVFFAPGDRFVWVATNAGTLLLDCQPTSVRVVSQFSDILTNAVCSPDGRYILASLLSDQVNRLYRVERGRLLKTNISANPKQSIFSPDGRFLCLLATEGLVTEGQLLRLAYDEVGFLRGFTAQQPLRDAAFSLDSRWLIWEGKARNTIELARLDPDTVRVRSLPNGYTDRLTEAFSTDGRWLLLSFHDVDRDSLWAVTHDSLYLHQVFKYPKGTSQTSELNLRVLSRFSPEGSWLLRSSQNGRGEAQCWSLRDSVPRLLHQFVRKIQIQYDEFSADGRYLLSRHLATDSLWQCTNAGLVPMHGFQYALRLTATPITGSAIYPSFSPDGRLLITYHSGALSDSLWQIGGSKLIPLYGFRERLSAAFTLFSANSQWVLGSGNALTDKILYQTNALWSLHKPQLQLPLFEARFSESGQYLLGRSMMSDAATVLYRAQAGQLTLLQKLRQSFWLSESQFLGQDRFLFTCFESKNMNGVNQFANYIWRITNDGLAPFYRFHKPYIQTYRRRGGTQRVQIERGLLIAPDGQHVFTHTGSNISDSLWTLTDTGLVPLQPVEPTEIEGDIIKMPAAGFIGSYFWQMQAKGRQVTLQPIQPNPQVVYPLPKDVRYLFGFSPRTGYGVFARQNAYEPVLHRYRGGQWQALQRFSGSEYDYEKGGWPDEIQPNILSPDGRLLFIKDKQRMWLYRLAGSTVSLLYTQAGEFQSFAFASEGGTSNGVVCSNLKETFWLSLKTGGCRVVRVGEGVLHQRPTVRNGRLYIQRRLTDGRIAIDVIEQATATQLAQTVVRQFLDMTIRPDGTVWIATTEGIVMLYTPTERLAWLRRSGLALLSRELAIKYAFD